MGTLSHRALIRRDDFEMGMSMHALLVTATWLGNVLVLASVAYAVIRFATVHALRQARHEARLERRVPNAATWLKGEERDLLNLSNTSRDGL